MTYCSGTRSTQAERMDDATLTRPAFEACLRSLERVNIATLAYRPTLHWLRSLEIQNNFTLLDVGSGGGDMLRRIFGWTKKQCLSSVLTGIDLSPWSKSLADDLLPQGANIQHETIDLFDLPPERTFDLIVSSLFTHHLKDAELVRFLRWMEQHATGGWMINDLHRHAVPYHFIAAATALLRMNPIVRHDAPVSVARSFTRADWQRLLAEAGIPAEAVRIRWFFPFRYRLDRLKS